jgi:hypothetical protein
MEVSAVLPPAAIDRFTTSKEYINVSPEEAPITFGKNFGQS